ncbi:MAG: hypothetical protein E7157_03915 [Lactobacillales bacterium]|nr:hypothetical protein [Lactobacillales bacterium]
MLKYVILDFGKVIAGPTTGDWFMTPCFLENVDINLIDKELFKEALNKYGHFKDGLITTLEEEYECFYNLYSNALKEINYPKYCDEIAKNIAHNFTYKNDKYTFYNGIEKELEELNKKYTLILLTDNWPCVNRILDEKNLTKYFSKIYVSSIYGKQKKDYVLFDYPISDYNIKEKEAIFIDDNESLLDIAKLKGLDVMLMDREGIVETSKYNIINNLKNL